MSVAKDLFLFEILDLLYLNDMLILTYMCFSFLFQTFHLLTSYCDISIIGRNWDRYDISENTQASLKSFMDARYFYTSDLSIITQKEK